jgi:hypothetical protein
MASRGLLPSETSLEVFHSLVYALPVTISGDARAWHVVLFERQKTAEGIGVLGR